MLVKGVQYRTVWMENGVVKLIDQRRLPAKFEIIALQTYRETAEAIRTMAVRGAGAIGVAAGYAMAQATLEGVGDLEASLAQAASVLRQTRPTARNLFYAIERVQAEVAKASDPGKGSARAVEIAEAIANEDASAGERIGQIGQKLFGASTTLLTHCNAGWLAFADWGTALAPVYRAKRDKKKVMVYHTETRPWAQGARLTAWELAQENVPHALIPDTAVGHLMQKEALDLVIVGADRVAANGDVANKIGTYTIAVLAKTHKVPFYVAAPTTTIDLSCPSGGEIPIEERSSEEVACAVGTTSDGKEECIRIAPEGCGVRNWVFDVTPAEYITGLLTEKGLIRANPGEIQELMGTQSVSTKP